MSDRKSENHIDVVSAEYLLESMLPDNPDAKLFQRLCRLGSSKIIANINNADKKKQYIALIENFINGINNKSNQFATDLYKKLKMQS